ncbi:phytoene desaturase family protein [Bdellovibrio sp. HCB337]|uniref:phytoene desaturase family protein n=1 Tax=Bdellovibrio sp. HCB337 TaxID=3394358 RepID=UPI0039A65025
MKKYEAIVVGSGPNGLAAAITLAKAGVSVLVLEAARTPGGGARSEPLTIPGFIHDVCSAVHPMAVASPFFKSLPLEQFGLEWVHSQAVLAHPLENNEAILLHTSVEATAKNLDIDGEAYYDLMQPMSQHWEEIFSETMGPLFHWPKHPMTLASFGLKAIRSAEIFARMHYHGPRARALFAGMAAHVNTPLDKTGTAAIGLMLNLAAHAKGWPFPRGGAQKLTDALLAYFRSLGGDLQTHREIRSMRDLPSSHWVFLDLTPRQILSIFADSVSHVESYRWNSFSYGPAVFKIDWALSAPIPWSAKECLKAATVHVCGDFDEILLSESAPIKGKLSQRPFVLLTQPSLFDLTRAPQGQHTAWAYCHVPHDTTVNCTEIIEAQIERFAPGFKKNILARHILGPQDLQKRNPNLVGGDIMGGAFSLKQLLFGPSRSMNPYHLSIPGFFICSSSTPPGPGVHGMCGFNAAQNVLREL